MSDTTKVWKELQYFAFLLFIRFLTSTPLTISFCADMDPSILKKLKWAARAGSTVKVSSVSKPKKVWFDSHQLAGTI